MHLSLNIITVVYISLVSTIFAEQDQVPLRSTPKPDVRPHRIAIIGAGAGGSSAAYHLSKFANASTSDVPVSITIFDVNSRVGGRTTTVNALDDPRYPTELGASIFVKINEILYNATRDFNLDTKERSSYSTGSAYDLGIWDGTNFVLEVANDETDASLAGKWKGWWDIAKLLWKYGLSPIKTQRLSKRAVGAFLQFYDNFFPFQSLDEAVGETGLTEFTGSSGKETLLAAGISEHFSRDVIQASTRVNYAQNLGSIHGLETMVSMAIEGAMAVEGGNWQIFDEAVKRSQARVYLETAVTAVAKDEIGRYHVSTNQSFSRDEMTYDTVILAAPYQHANITFTPPLPIQPSKIDYVSLHVTLFTSPHRPSPSYFNLTSQDQIPDTILTTLPPGLDTGTSRGSKALGATKFWSLSTLRVLEPSLDPLPPTSTLAPKARALERQYLYKIFSPEPITASHLTDLFALNRTETLLADDTAALPISSLPKTDITWSYAKNWNSYPYLPPRTKFDPFNLDPEGAVWYTSAIESFISTMETSALSGMNIARLIVDGLEQEGKVRMEREM